MLSNVHLKLKIKYVFSILGFLNINIIFIIQIEELKILWGELLIYMCVPFPHPPQLKLKKKSLKSWISLDLGVMTLLCHD